MQSVSRRDAFSYSIFVLVYILLAVDTGYNGMILEPVERLAFRMAILTQAIGGFASALYGAVIYSKIATGMDIQFVFTLMSPEWVTDFLVHVFTTVLLFIPLMAINPLRNLKIEDEPVEPPEDSDGKLTDDQVAQIYISEMLKDGVSKPQLVNIIGKLMRIVNLKQEMQTLYEENESTKKDN